MERSAACIWQIAQPLAAKQMMAMIRPSTEHRAGDTDEGETAPFRIAQYAQRAEHEAAEGEDQ